MDREVVNNLTQFLLPLIIVFSLFMSCIGDDIIDDAIEPEIRINNIIDSIGLGSEYQFEASYFNNIGKPEQLEISWTSSNPDIISITDNGLAKGLDIGSAGITAVGMTAAGVYEARFNLLVGEETASAASIIRTGEIKSTSSYALEGDFSLISVSNDQIRLNLDENYAATRALPALFVYLSNNPNSISGAYEIGAVQVFEGAHSYEISGIGLNDYSYVLYYCKPFNVKVGEGKMEN